MPSNVAKRDVLATEIVVSLSPSAALSVVGIVFGSMSARVTTLLSA